jgi:hypothetical protein
MVDIDARLSRFFSQLRYYNSLPAPHQALKPVNVPPNDTRHSLPSSATVPVFPAFNYLWSRVDCFRTGQRASTCHPCVLPTSSICRSGWDRLTSINPTVMLLIRCVCTDDIFACVFSFAQAYLYILLAAIFIGLPVVCRGSHLILFILCSFAFRSSQLLPPTLAK